MIWREGKDNITNSYFCIINLKGINHKNKHHVQYLDVPSAIRPIPHGLDLRVSKPDGNMEYSSDSEYDTYNIALILNMTHTCQKRMTFDTSRTQQSDTKPETFLVFHVPRLVIFGLLQQHCWIDQINGLIIIIIIIIIIINGDYLLTHPTEVSKQFYIMGIVFHLSLLGIQYKWKKLTTAWIICCLLLTTRSTICWSVENIRCLDWS